MKANATKKPSIDVLQDSALLLPSAFSGPTRGRLCPSLPLLALRLKAFRTSLFAIRQGQLGGRSPKFGGSKGVNLGGVLRGR